MNKIKSIDIQRLLPSLTFLVLVLLIIIQVNWIFRAAKLEEQNFNHRVVMALKGARDEIGNRVPLCSDMSDFLCGRKCAHDVHEKKFQEVDSIISSNLCIYNISIPYTFEVRDSILHKSKGTLFTKTSYLQNLNGVIDQNGIQIKIQFPARNQFLLGQIWGQLGLSVLFILFVMYSFIITFRLFRREKALLMHTTDFINNMVHEFQTPIANVKLATNLIKKRQATGPIKVKEYTDVILQETQKLQQHVEEILKTTCSPDNLSCDEISDINEIISDLMISFKFRFEHDQATVSFIQNTTNAYIKAERIPISLIISNLIDNALKYVSGKPVIEIRTLNKDNNLIVKIKDNGIGLNKEDQKNIFDKFFRVNTGDVHNIKGFGLGLTYVQKVTKQYNGTITVDSSPNKGSTFTLTFPVTETHDNKTKNINN